MRALLRPDRRRPSHATEVGSATSGVLVAVLVLAAAAVAGFFYFGGEADVDIKKPEVTVSSDETPDAG